MTDENTDQPVEETEQDLSGYIGVDPIYMNYADDRQKPFRAESDGSDEADEVVAAQDRAYEVQAAVREASDQDPETGRALTDDEIAEKWANAEPLETTPNMPSAMTGKEEGNDTPNWRVEQPPAPPAPPAA